ncbi:tyrosine-protein phosphatase [Tundrisphaera lichenicola]|uniref:tyrosine-protein phosphatase n=1 Tax=Tundrisphaera lichenicola TaxID=2029860 RepID=UPI003EC01D6F
MRFRRLRHWFLRPLLIGLTLLGIPAVWMLAFSDNFGTVEPGRLYRSGQMGGSSLASKLREHRVRTVLNLRGSHPESPWYRDERAATLEAGGTQIDMPLSSCEWMSRAQARALLEVLETAERPLLVHCFHGSERTAIAAAFDRLLRPGSTLADAEAQFSARHMYFGIGDGVVTRQHLEQYEGWLRDRSLAHAPDHFRRWVAEGYRPGKPSRENWDFDPYPLVVVTRGVKRVADRR